MIGERYVDRDATVGVFTGAELYARNGGTPVLSSATWAVANQAVYIPIYIPGSARKFTRLSIYNGATASGNMDLGIYVPDSEGKPGAQLAHTGSIAQAGTAVIQFASLVFWARGLVYLACSMNGTTATVTKMFSATTNRTAPAQFNIYTQGTAFPLPSTATPLATGVAATVPYMAAHGVNF